MLTEDGFLPIEDVAVGMMVVAENVLTGEVELRPVLQTFESVAEGTVEVGLSTGDVIEVTSEHPFYEENFGWVPAEDLQPGMWLRTIDGAEVTVAYIEYHPTRGPPTYNFEVQGLHNYFVAPAGVLVHNMSCGGGSGRFARTNDVRGRTAIYQSQVTGYLPDVGYIQNGVKFDGFRDGVLLDAKGLGYARFIKNGKYLPWFDGQRKLVEQAIRQTNAANGTPIRWFFAEKEAADATRRLLMNRGLNRIEVIHQRMTR